jgi:hypothetical protein
MKSLTKASFKNEYCLQSFPFLSFLPAKNKFPIMHLLATVHIVVLHCMRRYCRVCPLINLLPASLAIFLV